MHEEGSFDMTVRERQLRKRIREEQISAWIKDNGLERLAFMGAHPQLAAHERSSMARASLSRSVALRRTGRGPNPSRDLYGQRKAGPVRHSVVGHVPPGREEAGWPELLAEARARTAQKR